MTHTASSRSSFKIYLGTGGEMKLTKQWLKKYGACHEAVIWYNEQKETDVFKLYDLAIKDTHFNWINWTITNLVNRKQRLKYAVYAAKQVLPIFEKKYPTDKRPHNAINAAIKCIENNTKKNKAVARAAADGAWATARAAADGACAAVDAVDAARATGAAAWFAAKDAENEKIQKQILSYGIKLLREQEGK